MICQKCKNEYSTVKDTRKYPDTVRRVRECEKCHHLWVTWEVEEKQIVVLKPTKCVPTKLLNNAI